MADFGWKNTILSSSSNPDISTSLTRNPWGRGSTQGSNDVPFNLHRTDLWYVDFNNATKGITNTLGARTSTVPAYYCKSITLPETRIKPEVFRRDSIPYNMPGCDEPLDAISITFWMESLNPNPVLQLLTDWMRIVRAGRGERYTNGYDATLRSFTPDDSTSLGTEITLDDDFRIEISYPIKLWLLQGAIGKTPTQQLVQTPPNPTGAVSPKSLSLTADFCKLNRVTGFEALAWLASLKVADLTYEGSQILTCEAKFFPEYIVQAEN